MGKKKFSDEKLLDMIRSILPSTKRAAARQWKAIETRRVRRRMTVAVQTEDEEETKIDFHEVADQRNSTVLVRRGNDKLNHFMRWCESWTRGMTERQKLDAVRAVLPRNLIGDHAYSHWKEHVQRRNYNYLRDHYERQEQSRYDKTRHRLRRALSVDPGFQARFNAAVKEKKLEGDPRRMLHGVHDIDDFVRMVLDCWEFSLERRVLLGLLEEAEQYRYYEIGTPLAALRRP